MRFSPFFTLTAASALAVAASPAARDKVYGMGGLREQLPIQEFAPSTRTRTVTETQTFYEVVETVYMTKPMLVPTWVAVAPQQDDETTAPETQQQQDKTEPAAEAQRQDDNVCDEQKEIGCAICRTIHQCGEFEEGCVACDTSPACAACQPALPSKQTLPPVIHLGMTCSLGPGRTVPCELVDKEVIQGPVYRFDEGAVHRIDHTDQEQPTVEEPRADLR